MHSTGNMSSFLQIIARPSTAAGTPPSTVDASTWCSTPSCSNHHRLSWVRMRPLSGISLAQHVVVGADAVAGHNQDAFLADAAP